MGYKGTTSGRFIDNLPGTIEKIQNDANVLKRDMANLEDRVDQYSAIAAGNVLTGVDSNALSVGRVVTATVLAGTPDSLYDQPTQTTILWTNGTVSSIVSCTQRGKQSAGWGMICTIPFDTGGGVTMLRVYFNYTSVSNTLRLQKA